MDNDKLDGYDKSFQLLQNLHMQLLILFCLIWCKGMYHANTGPKGVWLPTEVMTMKPGLQRVPANLFQVSCLPPESQLPVRQMCQAAGGRLEIDLLEGSRKDRRVKGTVLPA